MLRWGAQLGGCDIHPEFIRAAKLRLQLLAINRGATPDLWQNDRALFPHIRVGSFFNCRLPSKTTHVFMNPPFSREGFDGDWAKGLTNLAPRFVERAITISNQGVKIAAILPDVLRTGSRYSRWREKIDSMARIDCIRPIGHFGRGADVDVFTLYASIAQISARGKISWWKTARKAKVADYFSVHVGAVVPHRDKKRGPHLPFLDTGSTTPWTTLRRAPQWRQFNGTTHHSPFVIVRRTSSPHDRIRARATVINLESPAAVENHLLVLKPHDGTLASCLRLKQILKSSTVSRWLNQRIRCRHLTVGAVSQIPMEWAD